MPYTVSAVCRPEVGAGFALAGLASLDAADPGAGTGRVRALLEDRSAGIVLLEQPLYDALPDELKRDLGRRALPMIVPFPGPMWQAPADAAEAYIVELLRQVIGYRVRLR